MTTTAAQAVEIALQGVSLTEHEAERLHAILRARTRPATARERLDAHVDALRGLASAEWLHDARRLIREALAEQAQQALAAGDRARREGDLSTEAEHVYEAVRAALLTDRPGA